MDEIMRVQKLFVEFMYKGRPEAGGLPYKFPVVTANFKKENLEDTKELESDFFEYIAKKNHKGFININTSPRFAMCCFPPHTKVRTSKGWKQIHDIKKGEKVLTHRNRFKKVTETNIRNYKGKLLKITPYYHQSFNCTPEHPILTKDGWKEARNLTKNDYITKQIPKPHKKIRNDPFSCLKGDNKWWFLGFYLAEGSRTSREFGKKHRSWIITLSCGKHEADEVYEKLNDLEYYNDHENRYKPINIHKVERKHTIELRISSKNLWNFLDNFGRGAVNKQISNKTFNYLKCYKKPRKDLLEGYIDGDGHRLQLKDTHQKRVSIKSVSKKLLSQVKELLEFEGIFAHIRLIQEEGKYYIQEREVNCHNQYALQYGLGQTFFEKDDKYYYIKIRKIKEEEFNGKVYNFEVDSDETYTIPQGIVHNCRLNIDQFKFNSFGGGGLKLGSFRVVNINLPHIAMRCRDSNLDFQSVLDYLLDYSVKLLHIEMKILEEKIEEGFLKFFKLKWFNLHDMFFGTLSFHGLPEAVHMMLDKDITSTEGQDLARKIIDSFVNRADKELDMNINIEQAPSESATNTMARLNRDNVDYYSNQFVPLDLEIPLKLRVNIEGKYSDLLTGGSMCFINLDSKMDEKQSLSLHQYIYKNTMINQWCPNYGWTVCENGHSIIGEVETCPRCGSEKVNHYERVVGYLVNRDAVNNGRKEEMVNRVKHEII